MSQIETYEWDGGLCSNCKANHMYQDIDKSDGYGTNLFTCVCGHIRSQTDADEIEDGWEN